MKRQGKLGHIVLLNGHPTIATTCVVQGKHEIHKVLSDVLRREATAFDNRQAAQAMITRTINFYRKHPLKRSLRRALLAGVTDRTAYRVVTVYKEVPEPKSQPFTPAWQAFGRRLWGVTTEST